jgi:hypothetical protein
MREDGKEDTRADGIPKADTLALGMGRRKPDVLFKKKVTKSLHTMENLVTFCDGGRIR